MTPDEWREGVPPITPVEQVLLVFDKVLREHEANIKYLQGRVEKLERRPDPMQVYGGDRSGYGRGASDFSGEGL